MSSEIERPPSLVALVNRYITNKALGSDRRYDTFHPSAWGSCLRAVAYQYYNSECRFKPKTESDVDQRMERLFDNGHYMHARWQKYLSESGIIRGYWSCKKCDMWYGMDQKLGILNPKLGDPRSWPCPCDPSLLHYEELLVKSDPRYRFEGHVDAVIDLRNTPMATGRSSDLFVVDFKSMKDSYFSELRYAKHEHVIQTHIYMWLLDINAAMVLYENKDNQNVKEMFVPRDEKIIDQIKEESVWMIKVLGHGRLPPRPKGANRSKPPCLFCEFKDICYS